MSFDRALTRFFTVRVPARPIAVFRIGLGLAALAKGVHIAVVLLQLAYDSRAVQARPYAWVPHLDHAGEILLYCGVWVAAALGLAIGWKPRWCALAVFACSAMAQVMDANLRSHHLYLLTLLMLLLSLLESDVALSVRRPPHRNLDETVERWPVLLLRYQVSIMYAYTVVAKLNPLFLSGTVIGNVVAMPASFRRPGVLATFAIATVMLESFLAVALWVRALRPWAFLFGFVFHASIAVLMGPALWVFSLMTVSLYAVFIDTPPRSRLVVWDDRCGFCRSSVRFFRRIDWFGVHRFEGSTRPGALAEAGITAEEANEEIKLWDGRRTYGGFDAVRLMLEQTPVGFLWARAFALPPLRWAGIRIYRAIASRRLCGLSPIEQEI